MSSIQPRKQRKAWYNAPLHLRRKQMASHLSEDLLLKYNVRRTPVVTGDEVKILRGDHHGETGKVVSVDTKRRKVVVEGITHKKADGTDVAMPVDASNLLITRLNLEDKRRRAKLGADEEKAAKTPSEAGKSAAKKAPAKKAAKTPSEAGKSAAKKAPAKKAAKKTAAKPAEAEATAEASE